MTAVRCSDVLLQLESYWARELPEPERRALEAHLACCEDCRLLAEGHELAADLDDPELARLVLTEPPPLPDDFTDRVMARVAAEKPRPFNLLWPWLRTRWSAHQYASLAYALCATFVVVSLGNGLFLWSQATSRLAVWAARGQAYWAALEAHAAPFSQRLLSVWYALTAFLY